MTKRRRVKIAEGIYDDQFGRAATVKIARWPQREQRFDKDTPIVTIAAWRARTRADLLEERERAIAASSNGAVTPVPIRGTIRGDAPRYFKLIAGRPGSAADRSHLQAWIDRYGDLKRSQMTGLHVRTALAEWRREGTFYGGRGSRARRSAGEPASEKTLQQRWRVLKHYYKTLDGARARTPCDDVERPQPTAATPVGVHISVVQRVADRLATRAKGTPMQSDERKDLARYLMLTTTAQRPAQLMRAITEDFHLAEQFWIVRGAKGGPTHAIHLNTEMRKAVKLFLAAGAIGRYNDKNLLAVARAHGWPKHIPLYNARHSVAIDALHRGADLGDVQAMLGHASIETTRRFYGGIAKLRQRQVGQRLEGRMKIG